MNSVAGDLKGSLMVQGTTSDAGKSICVAGLCRVLKRRGVSVAPFKSQNMALNSAVTSCGGEIGRAQALQAFACGLEPQLDFNPVLLKPSGDKRSQVIIHGKAVSDLDAERFGDIKSLAFEKVLESYERLQSRFDVVVIEGAGSPAEVNLRQNDIANMGFAEAVDCPVVLIGDINRGGVFAHLTGTLNLLSQSEQQRIKGFIINFFRGDLSLLQSGLDWLQDYTRKPVFGVLPYIQQLKLDAEDAINLESIQHKDSIKIKVPVFPRISNHTDFDPLRWHPDVALEFIPAGGSLMGADVIILPGSKSVRDDLAFLKRQGWDKEIKRHLRYDGKLLGICGGFQMLGNALHDPQGIESTAGASEGLGLLEMETTMTSAKQLTQVTGHCLLATNESPIKGYEIHCGVSQGDALQSPFARIVNQRGEQTLDGVISPARNIIGTYLHGLFESGQSLTAMLDWFGESVKIKSQSIVTSDWQKIRNSELDRLADIFEEHLDLNAIFSQIGYANNSQRKI
jgi:adenosylcobyric acid synthase